MKRIQSNLKEIRERITAIAKRYDRDPKAISLIAVSKQQNIEAISDAIAAGQWEFGENYLQEAIPKIQTINNPQLIWHFIGKIQSNKTRAIAENFQWVHSIDHLKIAERLSLHRPKTMPALNLCIQINIDHEHNKSGIDPNEIIPIAKAISLLPNLRLRGLMVIPKPQQNSTIQREAFSRARRLFESLKEHGLLVDTLSMGMSNDLEAAIAEGSNCVRIGTAIFGLRRSSKE